MSIVNLLGESAVRSLALALAVWVVLRLLRIQHAQIAKRAWTAVLVLALAMPVLVALHIPSFSFTARWAAPQTIVVTTPPASVSHASAVAPANDRAIETSAVTLTDFAPPLTSRIPVPSQLQGPAAPERHFAWWQIGFAGYLAITALMLFRVLLGLALATRLWRRAQPFSTSETNLPVRLSVDLRSPATVGHGILLPLEAVGWDGTALRVTLAHEVQHIREGDFYLQLAATLHHCFFWISPHAWWLRPQLSRLSETICDRAAVASGGDGLSYAQLLIRFAAAEQAPAGMVAMAQSAGLRERINRLIDDPQLTGAFRRRRGQSIAAAALFTAAALAAAASIHIVQPQTVVFAAPQAPAAPPAMQSVPTETPELPSLLAPAPDVGAGVGEGVGVIQSDDTLVPVQPEVHIRVKDLPPGSYISGIPTQIYAAPHVGVVPPVVALGPMTMLQPRVMVNPRMKILAMPHVIATQDLDNDVVILDGRNYAICGPDKDGTVHDCFLDGYSLKDHKGPAVLFERDGKTYIIDDPALVKEAQDAFAPVKELGKQQGELGKKQGKLGAQQGELGALQGQLGSMQGELGSMEGHFAMPTIQLEMPKDFDQAIQNLTDSTTRLALEEHLSEQQRAQLEAERKQAQADFDKALAQWKAQEPQREAMEKQIREQAEQIRKQMQPLIDKMGELGSKQAVLGGLQAQLGRQQELLGMQQRDASREADIKMRSLIDRAMKDGKARPAE